MSTNQLTLESMAAWCDKKDKTEYKWDHPATCACGQYAEYLGISNWHMVHMGFSPKAGKFWSRANDIAAEFPRNFRSLAARLRIAAAYERGTH